MAWYECLGNCDAGDGRCLLVPWRRVEVPTEGEGDGGDGDPADGSAMCL